MRKFIAASIGALLTATAVPASSAPPTRDYFSDKFTSERLLDWGDRPVFSPDSKRIVFTKDDEHLGPAYEIELSTKKVRCLTCRWGVNGYVSRIYYLNDGSFLLTAPADLAEAEKAPGDKPVAAIGEVKQTPGGKPAAPRGTYIYWMPADLSTPPQLIGPVVIGEVALDYDHSPPGETRIAWGEWLPNYRLVMGNVVNDGKHAWLVNRTLLLDKNINNDPKSLVSSFIEAYDFVDDGKSVLFFAYEKGRLYNGMYKLDIATSRLTSLRSDAQHNETHSMPDLRYGLEESNRASDPNGPYRGLSGHRAGALSSLLAGEGEKNADAIGKQYGGKTFDLYMYEWQTGRRRQLTALSAMGGEAHQSSPARDGKHIAYSVRSGIDGRYTGPTGLFLGTFGDAK